MKNEVAIRNIREFMENHEIKQIDIVNRTGLAKSVVSEILNGKRSAMPLVNAMVEYYGIDKEVLLHDESSQVRTEVNYNTGVPYYDVDFLGGFDIMTNDQTVNPDYYVDFKPFKKATCWCNITGHSMEPEISHGDMIAIRKIEDWSFLTFGEIYAIVTRNDMRTVKRLGPGSTKDSYMLIPANKSGDYAPQEIEKKDIRCVFEVLGCMKKF